MRWSKLRRISGKREFAHSAPGGIAHQESLVGDSLALEAAVLGVADGLLSRPGDL